MPRWNRIEELTEIEKKQLDTLVATTPGMHAYGNRARLAVMLPLDVAIEVAREMKRTGRSAGSVCGQLLEKAIKEKA
tara:strand:+ start:5725 stop:5955 length:231 start_codon:yes stop_codon:yes gene_type:complete